jgi:hypothetical protein
MPLSIPRKLYKYQSFNDISIKNIKERTIWFSKPRKLNDPFDMSISLRFGRRNIEFQELADYIEKITPFKPHPYQLTKGRVNRKYIDACRNIFNAEMKKRNDLFQQWGVACFSEIPDNILMWSHYADGHKGFCLEFDTSFDPFLNHNKVHKVIYSDSYPFLHPKYIIEKNEFPITTLITKSKKWKYELEWRLLSRDGDTSIVYGKKALSSIYFGYLMPPDQISKICSLLIDSKVDFYKMNLSKTKYELLVEPYRY